MAIATGTATTASRRPRACCSNRRKRHYPQKIQCWKSCAVEMGSGHSRCDRQKNLSYLFKIEECPGTWTINNKKCFTRFSHMDRLLAWLQQFVQIGLHSSTSQSFQKFCRSSNWGLHKCSWKLMGTPEGIFAKTGCCSVAFCVGVHWPTYVESAVWGRRSNKNVQFDSSN